MKKNTITSIIKPIYNPITINIAKITINNARAGKTFTSGNINPKALEESFELTESFRQNVLNFYYGVFPATSIFRCIGPMKLFKASLNPLFSISAAIRKLIITTSVKAFGNMP
jgi:hypothetical protein